MRADVGVAEEGLVIANAFRREESAFGNFPQKADPSPSASLRARYDRSWGR